MDSLPIAKALELVYPSPSLHLDWEGLPDVMEKTMKLLTITTPWWKAKVPRNLLLPRSAEYFLRTRGMRHNMSLDQLETEFATEDRWTEAKPVAEELGAIIKASGGPFYRGSSRKYVVRSTAQTNPVSFLCGFRDSWSHTMSKED
jgi:hypothetical protein